MIEDPPPADPGPRRPRAGAGRRSGGAWAAAAVGAGAIGITMGDAVAGALAVAALPPSFTGPGRTAADLQWVVTAYAVPFAALLAAEGSPIGFRGARRRLAAGLALFGLAAAAAALAPSLPVLLLARAVQGVGAAAVVPAALWLLSAVTPARAGAAGAGAAAGWLGPAAMPAMGGWLLGAQGWRGLFVPSAVAAVLLFHGALALRRDIGPPGRTGRRSARRSRRPRALTAVATAVCAGGAVVVIAEVPRHGWNTARLALCGGGLVVLLGLVVLRLARRRARPAPPRRAAASGTAVAVSASLGAIACSVLLAAPLFLSRVWGHDLAVAAFAPAFPAGAALVAAPASGGLCGRYGPRVVGYLGALGVAASLAWIVTAALRSEPRLPQVWIPAGLLLGAGLGAMTAGVAAAARSRPPAGPAAALADATAAGLIGGAIGAAATAALLARPAAGGDPSAYIAVVGGCMVVAGLAGLAALLLRPGAFAHVSDTPRPALERARAAALRAAPNRLALPTPPRPLPSMPLSAPVPGDHPPHPGPSQGPRRASPQDGHQVSARHPAVEPVTGPVAGPAAGDAQSIILRITGPHLPPPTPPAVPNPAPAAPRRAPRARGRRDSAGRHRKPKNRIQAEGELRTAATGFLKAGDRLAVPLGDPHPPAPIEPAVPEAHDAEPSARERHIAETPADEEFPPGHPPYFGPDGPR